MAILIEPSYSSWFGLFSAIALVIFLYKAVFTTRRAKLPIYSTHSGWFASWHNSLEYLRDSSGVLRSGYAKFSKKGLFYQLRTPVRWVIVVPPEFVDEIRTAPPDYLSAKVSANDVVQTRYTVSPVVESNKFHFHILKTHLTPSLERNITDLLDEIKLVFSAEIGSSQDWKPVVMSHAAHRIATRTANRLLVGAPLCRNEEYLQMSIKYTVDVFGGADKLRAWPDFLKPAVTYLVTNVKERQKIARKHLIPYIKARLAEEDQIKEKGLQNTKPVDSLQWVIDAAPSAQERDPERLMYRLLHLNVSAVHTTSVTFLNCMFDLASHPEIITELREEIEAALDTYGWSARGLSQLRKLDSFMLESQRLAPIASCEYSNIQIWYFKAQNSDLMLRLAQMTRAVVRDFTFSDGTTVPKGSYVLVPMYAMYLDDDLYPRASEFDAFRWSKLRDQPGAENRYQFVTTSPTHINFGHGKDACPGRFFAAQEIKLLLAHVILHYDIRLEDPSNGHPKPTWYDRSRRPNQTARVFFRSR
ncbi:cytochrome P450 [Talaromyces proteolyticus]|uniref:Cytochrome P450 n=1 Tax=Talaromyces proteolyticus TaxID=1131652 RepID=A0AAD4PS48_9EURO|nr:cytochrome P450 [Talaromyces proteolyticus]KAH8690472.1 cytochrome P450 [Talaromyces proteolyticus]